MTSIIDIGFTIPGKRLTDEIYFKATKIHLNGERSVADYDEDSITLAYSAGEEALKACDRSRIKHLVFASRAPVYEEKLNSSVIATALDINPEAETIDLIGSQRSQISALIMASERTQKDGELSLVLSGESRTYEPGSQEEVVSGDAGAGLLISHKDEGIAVIEDYYSIFSNFMSSWRMSGERFPSSSEQKFSMEHGFQKIALTGIHEFLKKKNLRIEDISAMALIAPDGRSQNSVFKETGIKHGREEAEELFKKIGFCGTPMPFILFVDLLDKLKEGERALLCAYGDGFELILLRITGKGKSIKDKLLEQIDNKLPLNDYSEFLKLKGLIGEEKIKPFTSVPVLNREETALLRLYGTKCKKCSAIQYPPRRICWNCSAKDEMENVKLNKSGKIYTYTKDYVYTNPFPPTAMAVIDLDGGGRFYCQVVDSDKDRINIGSRMKLTLRRLHEAGDFVHYFWKAIRNDKIGR